MRSTKAATSVSASAIFILTLCLGCASTRTGRYLNAGVLGAASADYLSTRLAIQSGRGHEANSIVGNGALRQALVKALGVSAVLGFAGLVEKEKPILANVIRAAAIVTWSAISIRNVVVTR